MPAARSAIVGGFVLSGLVLGVAALLLVGGLRIFSTTEQAVVLFPGSIAGLTVGAPVTFRGVRVGSVRRISVRLDVKDLTAHDVVYLDLHRDSLSMVNGMLPAGEMGFERMLKAGLIAQLKTSSFVTGQLEVDLDLQPDIRAVPTGVDLGEPEIPSIASPFETLEAQIANLQLHQVVDTALSALASIKRVADQLGERVGPVVDDVHKTADAAQDTLRTARAAVGQIQTDAARTFDDFDQLAVEGRRQLTARAGELSHVLVEAGGAAHEAQTLATSLNDMVSPRSRTRQDLDATIRDLAATASSLREFSHEIERNPSLVLTGKAGPR